MRELVISIAQQKMCTTLYEGCEGCKMSEMSAVGHPHLVES